MASVLTETEQRIKLLTEKRRCELKNTRESYSLEGVHCNRTWDNILCWSDTPAGRVASQPCPGYINMFDQTEFVTRRCTENGTWWVNPDTGQPWSNYSRCVKSMNMMVPQLIQEHMPGIKMMYTVGYSLSLTALVLALSIMIYFKRLHCPRNIIHMNMFLAFGVRAILSLMKNVLLVNHLGFANDVNQTGSEMAFVDKGTHWQCKLFFTGFYYIIFSSVMWLFNEGLYLQLILSVALFSDQTKLRWFVLLGWGIPLLFIVPWVICRIYFDDMLCWNVHMFRGLYWIIHGPMVASVVINFVIFVNIVRMLFTKLTASNCPEPKTSRYRKLTKSTLILIPLFAVYYMVFMFLPDDVSDTVDLMKTSVEMLFNSFQGFLVAMLFCFLNHEVQQEVRTKWRRHCLKNSDSRRVSTFHPSCVHSSSADHEIRSMSCDLAARQFDSHDNTANRDAQHAVDKRKNQWRKSRTDGMNIDSRVSRRNSTFSGSSSPIVYLNFETHEDSMQPLIGSNPPSRSIIKCKDPKGYAITTDTPQQSLITCTENCEYQGKPVLSNDQSYFDTSSYFYCAQDSDRGEDATFMVLPINESEVEVVRTEKVMTSEMNFVPDSDRIEKRPN